MRKKIIIANILAAMMLIGTVGCGSSGAATKEAHARTTSGAVNSMAMEGAAVDYDYDYEYEAATEAAASEEFVGIADSEKGAVPAGDTTNTLPTIDAEKLVYHCDVRFDTEDYEKSINELKSLMSTYGAFLENENESNSGGYGYTPSLHTYYATIRIPSENYQAFLDNSGNIGELMNKSQNVTNLSQEYSDLSAELEVLEAKRESYLGMMKDAKTLDDMESLLMVDERLTEVEISINRIKTRMNSINNDVAYSYISIAISEVREYEDPVPESFGEKLSQSFENGWENFVEGCMNFVLWAAEHIIGLGIFLIIVLSIWFKLIRKPLKAHRAKRKAAKAARKAAKAEAEATAKAATEAATEAATATETPETQQNTENLG